MSLSIYRRDWVTTSLTYIPYIITYSIFSWLCSTLYIWILVNLESFHWQKYAYKAFNGLWSTFFHFEIRMCTVTPTKNGTQYCTLSLLSLHLHMMTILQHILGYEYSFIHMYVCKKGFFPVYEFGDSLFFTAFCHLPPTVHLAAWLALLNM